MRFFFHSVYCVFQPTLSPCTLGGFVPIKSKPFTFACDFFFTVCTVFFSQPSPRVLLAGLFLSKVNLSRLHAIFFSQCVLCFSANPLPVYSLLSLSSLELSSYKPQLETHSTPGCAPARSSSSPALSPLSPRRARTTHTIPNVCQRQSRPAPACAKARRISCLGAVLQQ